VRLVFHRDGWQKTFELVLAPPGAAAGSPPAKEDSR
jgi:hypothetical protein